MAVVLDDGGSVVVGCAAILGVEHEVTEDKPNIQEPNPNPKTLTKPIVPMPHAILQEIAETLHPAIRVRQQTIVANPIAIIPINLSTGRTNGTIMHG